MPRILGIIGGMSWQSTQLYYDRINTLVGQRLGGCIRPSCCILLISG